MTTHPNMLLARLSRPDYNRVAPHLTRIGLQQGDVLVESHSLIDKVYFPHTGILSLVVELAGGGAVETAIVGRDGAFGANQALNDKVSLNSISVQVPGEASTMPANTLRDLALELPEFRKHLLGFELFMFAQAQQTAACNALHQIRERTCKWLAQMQDLTGDDLPLTQEFLAQMIGVRRTSVSTVAQELQSSGLIEYNRGRIHIKDRQRLHLACCECYRNVVENYRVMTDPQSLKN
jgi:CRP-like cAMP-binding protein